jgi:kynurenine formamidase
MSSGGPARATHEHRHGRRGEHGVSGVGIDALSIGGWGGPERGEPSHLALLGAGKVIVEELRIPEELIGRRCFMTAFPVLLQGCGGAWTRAVAWELGE